MPADLLEELYEFAPAGAFIPFGTPVKQDDIPGFSPDSTEGGLYTKQGIGTSQERSQHHTSITVFFLVGEALGAGRERLSLRCSPVASKGERQVPFRTPADQDTSPRGERQKRLCRRTALDLTPSPLPAVAGGAAGRPPPGDQTATQHSGAVPLGHRLADGLVDRVDPRSWSDRHPPPPGYGLPRVSLLP